MCLEREHGQNTSGEHWCSGHHGSSVATVSRRHNDVAGAGGGRAGSIGHAGRSGACASHGVLLQVSPCIQGIISWGINLRLESQ